MPALRVAVLGAFNFPAPRGSQVFAREQAEALTRAGVDVTFVSYGGGEGHAALPFAARSIAPPLRPRTSASGLHPMKPAADLALALRLRRLHRRRPFDVVLAHNVEAALVAKLARRLGGPPSVYVAHTLFEQELPAYLRGISETRASAFGASLDRQATRACLGTLAISEAAGESLAQYSDAPVEIVAPGVPILAPCSEWDVSRACANLMLTPGQFVLYTGNLDAYQDLPLLDELAAELPELPVVVATHAETKAPLDYARVHCVTPEDIRPLLHGARMLVAPRRMRGGFPIKLLNAMEAGCAILAREGQATTLSHEHNAYLVPADAETQDFVAAAQTLLDAPAFARALGMQARHTAELHHDWDVVGKRTLRFVEALLAREHR